MNTKHTYTPRPLRETSPQKTAAEIQSDLDLMRVMYGERRSSNHRRHQCVVGYSLLAVALIVPIIAAAIILIF